MHASPISRPAGRPRAAAAAGIVFSLLLSATLVIVHGAIPPAPADRGEWIEDMAQRRAVLFAIHLAPFAGVAFLWFIAVLRDLMKRADEHFFSTVSLGSGLLFVASLFGSAACSGALIETAVNGHFNVAHSETYYLTRHLMSSAINVFAIKMAGVFIISTSTMLRHANVLPPWVSWSGYGCAAVLLLTITNWPWIALLFPFWILLLSGSVLIAEYFLAPATEPNL